MNGYSLLNLRKSLPRTDLRALSPSVAVGVRLDTIRGGHLRTPVTP